MHAQLDTISANPSRPSQLEHLPQDIKGLIWVFHSVTCSPWILVDFVVVATLEGFVAEEVNLVVFDSTELSLGFNVAEAVCLVPACWEDVERNLTTY